MGIISEAINDTSQVACMFSGSKMFNNYLLTKSLDRTKNMFPSSLHAALVHFLRKLLLNSVWKAVQQAQALIIFPY